MATVPFDLLLNFLVGASVALAARVDLRERVVPVLANRYAMAAVLFEVLIFWPFGIYLYVVHPDWSWMYLVDSNRLPAVLGVAAMLGYLGMLLAGYASVHRLLQRRKDRIALGLMGAVGLVLLVATIGMHRRLFAYGSYADFHAGRALPLWGTSLGYVLLGCGLVFGAGWAFLVRHIDIDGQRLASQGDLLQR